MQAGWLEMKTVLIGLAAAGLWAWLTAAPAQAQSQLDPYETIIGFAQALEGDLISVNGALVRLYGIDAPELDQICTSRRGQAYNCGAAARNVLERAIGSNEIECTLYARLSNGESVGRCFLGRLDLGGAMVIHGWAYRTPSLTNRYNGHEANAQASSAGIWSGRAQPPWVWRAQRAAAGLR